MSKHRKGRARKRMLAMINNLTIEKLYSRSKMTLSTETVAALQKMNPILQKEAKPKLIRINGKIIDFDTYDQEENPSKIEG